jgi:hypothetical protein
MEEQMLYLDALITIKGNKITKMSQSFQTTCSQEQAPPPTLILKPYSLLDSSHCKMKIYCAHGLICTISRSSMENGGKNIKG